MARDFLVVQWLRLCAHNAGGLGLIPDQGTRSRMPQLKIPQGNFPGGAVVKNPPANAGDTGSRPGPRRFHMHGATKPVHHNY